jgi:hypothetical protein
MEEPGRSASNRAFEIWPCSGGSNQAWELSPIAISESWEVTTLAGSATASGTVDGTGSSARFASPKGMSVDREGNAYTVDNFCCTLRKITPTGAVTTLPRPGGSLGTGPRGLTARPRLQSMKWEIFMWPTPATALSGR